MISFDFGTKNIGVAIGQFITCKANPLKEIKKSKFNFWFAIEKILYEWKPYLVVVGLPLNMDGSDQIITNLARKFANKINIKFGYEIKMQDERLTSIEAREKLFNKFGYKYLKKVNSISAVIILENWMQSYLLKNLISTPKKI
ncbi:MAG: Holliday junction resolvase RuvX [Candidatus Makana argininalis]